MYIHLLANIAFIIGLTCASFWAVWHKKHIHLAIAAAAVELLGSALHHRPDWYAALFPFAGNVFYSNWHVYGAALFLPCASGLAKGRWQRIRVNILAFLLLGVSLYPFRFFFLPPAQSQGTRIDANGVCLQSSVDTCSAASIVTLLHRLGIDATEEEVIRLALTKEGRGTNILGAYRALKILTASRANLGVRIERLTSEELISANQPAIVTVGVPKKPRNQRERDMIEKYNWDPGVVHQVVFLGRTQAAPGNPASTQAMNSAPQERVSIGEPAFGQENWPVESFEILFRGLCITITPQ